MNQLLICLVFVILLLKTKRCCPKHTILKPSKISFLKGLSGYISDKANVSFFIQEKNRKKYGSLKNPKYKNSLITDITQCKKAKNVYQFAIGFNKKLKGIKKITITDEITYHSFTLDTKKANTGKCLIFTRDTTSFDWCNIYYNKNFLPLKNNRGYIISFN